MTAKTDAPEGRRRRSVGFNYEGLSENACHKLAQFTRRPPSDLICDIGRGVLKDGVQNDGCRHQYCKQCIAEMQKRSSTCPVSGCDALIGKLQPLAKKMLTVCNDLEVVCSNEEKGCEWRGTLSALDLHLRTCSQHLPIRCEMCKQRVKREDMAVHASETCPKLPTSCPQCGVTLTAGELKDHLANSCPKKNSSNSPTPPTRGSPFDEPVMPDHLEDSIELDAHENGARGFRVIQPDTAAPNVSPRKKFARAPLHPDDDTGGSSSPVPEGSVARRGYSGRLGSSRRPVTVCQSSGAWGEDTGSTGSPLRGSIAGGMSPSKRVRQLSSDRTNQLWMQIEDARMKLDSGDGGGTGCTGSCRETTNLLLNAVYALHARVASLEQENDTLRLFNRRSPSLQFEPNNSPPPCLGPLKSHK